MKIRSEKHLHPNGRIYENEFGYHTNSEIYKNKDLDMKELSEMPNTAFLRRINECLIKHRGNGQST